MLKHVGLHACSFKLLFSCIFFPVEAFGLLNDAGAKRDYGVRRMRGSDGGGWCFMSFVPDCCNPLGPFVKSCFQNALSICTPYLVTTVSIQCSVHCETRVYCETWGGRQELPAAYGLWRTCWTLVSIKALKNCCLALGCRRTCQKSKPMVKLLILRSSVAYWTGQSMQPWNSHHVPTACQLQPGKRGILDVWTIPLRKTSKPQILQMPLPILGEALLLPVVFFLSGPRPPTSSGFAATKLYYQEWLRIGHQTIGQRSLPVSFLATPAAQLSNVRLAGQASLQRIQSSRQTEHRKSHCRTNRLQLLWLKRFPG